MQRQGQHSLRPLSLPPPKTKTTSDVTQGLTGKVCAPSRPNDRAILGLACPAPPPPTSLPGHLPVPGVSGQAASRTRRPLGLNYLAGLWPLKWLQRPPGGYLSLTCHHLFSWAPGLRPGHF